MRRIVGLLAAAVIVWFVVQRDAAPVSTRGASPTPVAAPNARTSDVLPAAERNAASDASPESAQPASNRTNSAQSSSTNPGRGFRDRAHLDEHFAKHGSEFPGLSAAQYLAMAQTLRDAPVGGNILEIIRASDGVASRFDRRSAAFLAFDRDGTIRTFFKPNDGEKYFRRQANRTSAR